MMVPCGVLKFGLQDADFKRNTEIQSPTARHKQLNKQLKGAY